MVANSPRIGVGPGFDSQGCVTFFHKYCFPNLYWIHWSITKWSDSANTPTFSSLKHKEVSNMSLDRYHFIIQFYSDNILLVPRLVVVDMGKNPHWPLKNIWAKYNKSKEYEHL